MFEEFYEKYPRKVAKKVAEKSWNKLTESEKREAMAALDNHIRYWKATNTEKEYIPHPATWLNQGRWDDEIEIPEIKKPTLPWYSSDELTLAKGRELGLVPYAGESFSTFRQRISVQISRQATV